MSAPLSFPAPPPPRWKMGISDPDNLFLGITNPDLAPNIEIFGALVVDVIFDCVAAEGEESMEVNVAAEIVPRRSENHVSDCYRIVLRVLEKERYVFYYFYFPLYIIKFFFSPSLVIICLDEVEKCLV